MNVGDRVVLKLRRGHRSESVFFDAPGTVAAVLEHPWGRSVTVELDEPTMVGHPDHPPTAVVSVSPCTLAGVRACR